MSPDDFQAALEGGQPVRVHLSDGRTHDIVDANTAHVGLHAVVAGIYNDGARFPRWTLLSLANVGSITPLTPAQLE